MVKKRGQEVIKWHEGEGEREGERKTVEEGERGGRESQWTIDKEGSIVRGIC